jgi:diguanylate cyclase
MGSAAPDPGSRRTRVAALALAAAAATVVVACALAGGWHVSNAGIVLFLAVAASIAAMQGIEFAPDLYYDPADPVVVLAGVLGGPVGGAFVGFSTAITTMHGWRSRLGYASTRAMQGAIAGVAVHALGLGYATTPRALTSAVVASAGGALVVFAVTASLSAAGLIALTRRVVLTNVFDPAVGAPLVAGLAVSFAAAGAGALLLLLLPSLLAATALRVVRERWAVRHAESEARARRDALTGAYNRFWFDEAISRELVSGGNAGLVLLDLDHFKLVNDEHGHAAGDAVLVEVVRRLTARVRPGDGVVRWGGEEFAVLLRDMADGTDLEARADDLRRTVGAAPFVIDGAVITVTASAGAATVAGDADSLVRAADAALYDAKRAGRDRAVLV